MPAGFFPESVLRQTKAPAATAARCGACGLYKACRTPKMAYTGQGKRRILLLGTAPGEEEDDAGRHFVSKAGRLLRDTLRKVGVDMPVDCWLHNAIICKTPGDRDPTGEELDHCRPNLVKVLDELKPDIIIPLGGVAVRALLGHVWREDIGPITRWTGWQIPSCDINAWICPTWDPAEIIKFEKRPNGPLQQRLFEQHLGAACDKTGRPHAIVPDYKAKVRVVRDPAAAAKMLDWMTVHPAPIAFDYETNMLKPDSDEAAIVCASVCWNGERTIAFPWQGPVLEAMDRLLSSSHPKIASNLKFEDRWTRMAFGHRVRNWWWDTMLASHWLDNRRGITSIKFQSFVLLGQPSYDEHIKPYLESKKGTKVNQILQEVDLGDLLLYCGLDSLLEYEVAMRQTAATGFPMMEYTR